MRAAIMQPYVFPYLGYHQLLHAADVFVLYDDVNFIKKGWINRNRILLHGEPHTFNIPVREMSQNRTIRQHMIGEDKAWRTKLLTSLTHAYSRAPMFHEVFPALEAMILHAEGSIAALAGASIRYVAERAGLPVKIHFASELALSPELRGQEHILAICAHHGAGCYINPANGAALYDEARFREKGIELRFLRMDPDVRYTQTGAAHHVPALSIIDVLMNCGREELRTLLGRYTLFTASELAQANAQA